jgi:putative transposase
MESFFYRCRKTFLNRQRWLTNQDMRLAITTWIDRTYYLATTKTAGKSHSHRI